MKLITLLLTLVFSLSAFATYNSYPQVQFNNYFLNYNDVCLEDGNVLRSINPVKVCIESYDIPMTEEDICLVWDQEILTTSRFYTQTICMESVGDNTCLKYETFNRTYPLTVNVDVRHEMPNNNYISVGNFTHTIPACY